MKKIVFMLSFVLPSIGWSQVTKTYINGRHFGDHATWNYIAEKLIQKSGDTIIIEKKCFDKNKIHKISGPTSVLHLKLLFDQNNNIVYAKDELFFNGSLYYSMIKNSDSVSFTYNQKTVKLKSPAAPLFTSMESVETYLSKQIVNNSFEREVLIGLNDDNTDFRKFRLKVVGITPLINSSKKLKECYELAIFSLDNSNNGDGKLYIDCVNGNIIKTEFIVFEKSTPISGLKSQAIEYEVAPNYTIDLNRIKSPSKEDYVEAAFSSINKNRTPNSALIYINEASKLGFSSDLFLYKIAILNYLNKNDEALQYVLENSNNPTLQVIDIHNAGRSFLNNGFTDQAISVFKLNLDKNPNNTTTLIGMARALSVKENYTDAKNYLTQALAIEKNENQIKWISNNIDRLARGEKII